MTFPMPNLNEALAETSAVSDISVYYVQHFSSGSRDFYYSCRPVFAVLLVVRN